MQVKSVQEIIQRDAWAAYDHLGNLIQIELAVDEDAMWHAYLGREFSEMTILDAQALGITVCKVAVTPVDPEIREKLRHAASDEPYRV